MVADGLACRLTQNSRETTVPGAPSRLATRKSSAMLAMSGIPTGRRSPKTVEGPAGFGSDSASRSHYAWVRGTDVPPHASGKEMWPGAAGERCIPTASDKY